MRFESLRETLLKAGIAPRHVRRYLRELTDHLEDLASAEREAGRDEETALVAAVARLGGDDELASAMLAQPGFKSWATRWPWLVFGVAPPLAMLAAVFAVALPLVLIADLRGSMGPHGVPAPGWFLFLANGTVVFANLALGPGLAALLVAAAWRQRLNPKWPLLASVIIAILGVHMVARFAQTGRINSINIGVLMELSHAFGPSLAAEAPIFLAQFLLTLAPALWLLWHQRFARLTEPR
jgi:hypothetical protein